MKITLFFIILTCLFIRCSEPQLTPEEIVSNYYRARDAADYKVLKTVVYDSITIIAGDFVMPYDPTGFYEEFKWDSVFKPSYTVVESRELNNQVFAAVRINSIRNEFLKNTNMTCNYKISFTAGKISRIEELDCRDVDWKIWAKERDSLVEWIRNTHPELIGFVNDMTMNGAQNYIKAIELYKTEKNAF